MASLAFLSRKGPPEFPDSHEQNVQQYKAPLVSSADEQEHDSISSQDASTNSMGAIAHSIKTALGFGNDVPQTNAHSILSGAKTNFDKIVETSTSFQGISVSLYKSRETGLKVLIANVDVPIVCFYVCPFRLRIKVHGFFTLATEILNDSGCPHVYFRISVSYC